MMGKRPLLFRTEGGEIGCTSIEIKDEEALTILDAVALFQRLAKEFLQDKNIVWAFFGEEWVVEPHA